MKISRLAVALCAAAGTLVTAAPACAASLTVDQASATATYQAGAGENNNLSIIPLSSTYRIQDTGVPAVTLSELAGSLSCSVLEPWKLRCPAGGLTHFDVSLADGTDSFDDSTTSLATVVHAGAGAKTISTGSGADVIDARNGADHVSCGAGDDTVLVDADDVVDSSCEHVLQGAGADAAGATLLAGGATGAGSAPGGTATTRTSAPFTTPLGLVLPAGSIPVSASNTAIVALSCAASAAGGCRGDVTLELPGPAAKRTARLVAARGHYLAQQRARGRRLGRRSFRLAAGESAKLPVRVAFRGHFALASKRHQRALMRVTERDASGRVVDTQSRMVMLKRTNKWSRLVRRHR